MRIKRLAAMALLGISLFVVGCGSGSAPGSSAPPTSDTATFDPASSLYLEAPSNSAIAGASVSLSSGAFPSQTQITIAEAEPISVNAEAFFAVGTPVALFAVSADQSSMETLSAGHRASLRIPYSISELSALSGALEDVVLLHTTIEGENPRLLDFVGSAGLLVASVDELGLFTPMMRAPNTPTIRVDSADTPAGTFRGGNVVTLRGAGFFNPMMAYVDGELARSVHAISPSEARMTFPAGRPGQAIIDVRTPLETQSFANLYRYQGANTTLAGEVILAEDSLFDAPLHSGSLEVEGDRYVIGGRTTESGNFGVDGVWRINSPFAANELEIEEIDSPSKPTRRFWQVTEKIFTPTPKIFVWGGRTLEVENPNIVLPEDGALFDVRSQQWTALPSENAPTPRYAATSWVVEVAPSHYRVYVYGGFTGVDVELFDGAYWDSKSNSWHAIASPPGQPAFRPTLGNTGYDPLLKKAFLYDYNSETDFYVYSVEDDSWSVQRPDRFPGQEVLFVPRAFHPEHGFLVFLPHTKPLTSQVHIVNLYDHRTNTMIPVEPCPYNNISTRPATSNGVGALIFKPTANRIGNSTTSPLVYPLFFFEWRTRRWTTSSFPIVSANRFELHSWGSSFFAYGSHVEDTPGGYSATWSPPTQSAIPALVRNAEEAQTLEGAAQSTLAGAALTLPAGALSLFDEVMLDDSPHDSFDSDAYAKASPTIRISAKDRSGTLRLGFNNDASATLRVPISLQALTEENATLEDLVVFFISSNDGMAEIIAHQLIGGENALEIQAKGMGRYFAMIERPDTEALEIESINLVAIRENRARRVQINGKGFLNPLSVHFGALQGTNAQAISPYLIEVTVPADGPGAVDIVVSTPIGTATLDDGLTRVAMSGEGAGRGYWLGTNDRQYFSRSYGDILFGNAFPVGTPGLIEDFEHPEAPFSATRLCNWESFGSNTTLGIVFGDQGRQIFHSSSAYEDVNDHTSPVTADAGFFDLDTETFTRVSTDGVASPRYGTIGWAWKNGLNSWRIYQWGGVARDEMLNGVALADGAVWSSKDDLWFSMATIDAPSPRNAPAFAFDKEGGKAYFYGGLDDNGTLLGGGFVFDCMSHQWSQLPTTEEIVGVREVVASTFVPGHGFVVYTKGPTPKGFIFDPVAQTWSEMASQGAPAIDVDCTMTFKGNRLFVVGFQYIEGSLSARPLSAMAYDLSSNSWHRMWDGEDPGFTAGENPVTRTFGSNAKISLNLYHYYSRFVFIPADEHDTQEDG